MGGGGGGGGATAVAPRYPRLNRDSTRAYLSEAPSPSDPDPTNGCLRWRGGSRKRSASTLRRGNRPQPAHTTRMPGSARGLSQGKGINNWERPAAWRLLALAAWAVARPWRRGCLATSPPRPATRLHGPTASSHRNGCEDVLGASSDRSCPITATRSPHGRAESKSLVKASHAG